VEGANHVGVRLAVVGGRLDADALFVREDWPALFDSFEEMALANGADSRR